MTINNYQSLKKAKEYSRNILTQLREDFENQIKSKNFCIVTTGSYARSEASKASDLDCFIIVNDKIDDKYFNYTDNIEINDKLKQLIKNIIYEYIKKDAGDTGTFGLDAIVNINDLVTNIGGTDDSNIRFTRRMLFLLEGKYLYNDNLFNEFRQKLIETYIKSTVSDNQLSKFFLNDIIRFYRTMTTDFEHKIAEKDKSWGLRNIKLTFSRKLLYFGGIIAVAETAQKTRDVKILETLKLLDMSPLERIERISGYRADKVFKLYNYFLEKLSNNDVRKELDKAKRTDNLDKNIPIFRELKNESKHFSWALSSMLKQTYDETHPIHHALVF
jgi:predicted nucleotidyltransferase